MAMVLVVNDAHISDARRCQGLDDGDLVVGLAKPAPVVIEADFRTDLRGFFGNRLDSFRLLAHARLLFYVSLRGVAAACYPKLRGNFVFSQCTKNDSRLAV